MRSVNILHVSDIHIGSEFDFLDSTNATIRKNELLETFVHIVEMCNEKKVDILLIAGDLFDNNHPSPSEISAINSAFERIPNTRIFIALGNHDFMSVDISKFSGKNNNIYIFPTQWECVHLDDLGVNVYGKSFEVSQHEESFLDSFDLPVSEDNINIMLMHGDIVSKDTESCYNPILESRLKALNMDYIALGHIHNPKDIAKSGNITYAYSGSPEGIDFDDTGKKGVYFGEIINKKAIMSFVPTCKREFVKLEVDVSSCETSVDICYAVKERMKDYAGDDYRDNLYKITLIGDSDISIEPSIIESRLQDDIFYVDVQNKTNVELHIKFLAGEKTMNGIFAKKMLNFYDKNGETENARQAYSLAIRALRGEKIGNEN